MFDGLVDALEGAMNTPWIYLAVFAIAAIDAFFPVVPSETLAITAGVFAAATGAPNAVLVVLVAGAGAFAGDHVSYAIGRFGGTRVVARAQPGSRSERTFGWARRALFRRGGQILVVARYVPGGRTAVTLTCGSTGYPLRRFSLFDAIAALSWGIYSTSIGYFGGRAFEEDPLLGVLTGFAVAITITVVIEAYRYLQGRRMRHASRAAPDEELHSSHRARH